MSVLPNLIYRLSAVPIKIPASYFVDIDKLILDLYGEAKNPRIAHTVLKQKNKVGGLTVPKVKTYNKSKVIKTV